MTVILRGLVLGFALAVACPAFAQDSPLPPLKKNLVDGTFVDQYYGLTYTGEGLTGQNKQGRAFSGKLADGTDVDIEVAESTGPLTAAEWLEWKKGVWKREKLELGSFSEGTTPTAWARYFGKTKDGKTVLHGYAFYPRGLQVFIVHARVRQTGDDSVARVTKALHNLKVDPNTKDSYRLAIPFGARAGKDPRAPGVLIQAAAAYAAAGANRNPELAKAAAEAAQRNARLFSEAGKLAPEASWALVFYGTMIHLDLGEYEQAVKRAEQCVPLAKGLKAESRIMVCQYNLARAYAGLGRNDEAIQQLTAATGGDDVSMRAFITKQAGVEADFEKLRSDPRWKKLFDAPAPKGK